ncbi:MAG TPA: hypothetical protein VGO13_09480 [Solirubrobacterales bacterium]|nr:hypothetical protein [Solirubrobacterales bacterium]
MDEAITFWVPVATQRDTEGHETLSRKSSLARPGSLVEVHWPALAEAAMVGPAVAASAVAETVSATSALPSLLFDPPNI